MMINTPNNFFAITDKQNSSETNEPESMCIFYMDYGKTQSNRYVITSKRRVHVALIW